MTIPRCRPRLRSSALLVVLLLTVGLAPAVWAQSVDDLFSGFGTAERAEEGDGTPGMKPGEGGLRGRVFDRDTGIPVVGVAVIVQRPASPDRGRLEQEVVVTDSDGAFEVPSLAVGVYSISFVKSGYRASKMIGIEVAEGEVNRADFPIQRIVLDESAAVLELEAFVVEASTVDEMMAELELRMDADEMLNVMSAEDFSKFAAGDVAEVLKRVAGVNVVEGQFAIIRGLEDRYSSTLFNGAPVPSPDPDRQSVQLDLFPSDVVSNLIVSKTFSPEDPSNSSGGSIDIITQEYPEEFEFKISAGGGANDNATERFLELRRRSPIGKERDGNHVTETDWGGSIGGRREVLGRELRFKAVYNNEVDYQTKDGQQEAREAREQGQEQLVLNEFGAPILIGIDFTTAPPTPIFLTEPGQPGDLSIGQLSLSGGLYDLTESERSEQTTGYAGFGFDIDREGKHRIDLAAFHTQKEEDTVQLRENGYLPNFDYETEIAAIQGGSDFSASQEFADVATLSSGLRDVRQEVNDSLSTGGTLWASRRESKSFQRERELDIYQINGDHDFDADLEGLRLTWAGNRAETTQRERNYGVRYFFEQLYADPPDLTDLPTVPSSVEDFETGAYFARSTNFSVTKVEEAQDFGRIDAEYERSFLERMSLRLGAGGWYERADRDVDAAFLEVATVGGNTQWAIGDLTEEGLGEALFRPGCESDGTCIDQVDGTFQALRESTNESSREIWAWNVNGKLSLFDRIDLLAGVRVEDITIESNNDAFQFDPFTGEEELQPDGSPKIFPNKYLFCDRFDNAASEGFEIPGPYNDEVLGIDVPIDPSTGRVDLETRAEIESCINGEIDENLVLPSYGVAVRPFEGLSLRGAYSRTSARPSFREIGYYVSVEPGSDDLVVGNPQLKLSDVESWDLRAEYTWGDLGDLLAVSGFRKTIKRPIESVIIRDPQNFEAGSSLAQFRTFFNNPSKAHLQGIEVEGRKSFDFLEWFGGPEIWLRYLSVGGNATYIDAEVDRTEQELQRSQAFFGVGPEDVEQFDRLEPTRRLFGQPKWIINADVTFDHPDWGTKATVAFFQISDVLDAAGSSTLLANGDVASLTLDRYVDSFHSLDAVFSQEFPMWRGMGKWKFKASAKNLTDSTRKIVYDTDQTVDTIDERRYKVGRDYSISLTYELEF